MPLYRTELYCTGKHELHPRLPSGVLSSFPFRASQLGHLNHSRSPPLWVLEIDTLTSTPSTKNTDDNICILIVRRYSANTSDTDTDSHSSIKKLESPKSSRHNDFLAMVNLLVMSKVRLLSLHIHG